LYPDGDVGPWAGAGQGYPRQEAVGGYIGIGDTPQTAEWVRWPINPDRPDDRYFRWIVECPRETCNYRKEIDDKGDRPIRALLLGLREAGVGISQHPSGAPMMTVELNSLLQRGAGG
jgi:hypothetical protein